MPCLEREYAENMKRDYGTEVFIETGTYKGSTILNMVPLFDELHTIEFGKEIYEDLINRYGESKINFHNGDSAEKLSEILKNIDKKVLFFLDAHYSGGDTAGSWENVPLLKELEAIIEWGKPCVVIIDDVRIFNTACLNVSIDSVKSIVNSKMKELYYLPSCLDKHDRMVIVI